MRVIKLIAIGSKSQVPKQNRLNPSRIISRTTLRNKSGQFDNGSNRESYEYFPGFFAVMNTFPENPEFRKVMNGFPKFATIRNVMINVAKVIPDCYNEQRQDLFMAHGISSRGTQ